MTGDITDEEARIRIENKVGPDTQFVIIRNTTNLTTVDLSNIVETIDIDNKEELTSINFATLRSVPSIRINFNFDVTSTFNFSSLKNFDSVSIFSSGFGNLSPQSINNFYSRLVYITPPITGKRISISQIPIGQ